jgi:hypothetical protein
VGCLDYVPCCCCLRAAGEENMNLRWTHGHGLLSIAPISVLSIINYHYLTEIPMK